VVYNQQSVVATKLQWNDFGARNCKRAALETRIKLYIQHVLLTMQELGQIGTVTAKSKTAIYRFRGKSGCSEIVFKSDSREVPPNEVVRLGSIIGPNSHLSYRLRWRRQQQGARQMPSLRL